MGDRRRLLGGVNRYGDATRYRWPGVRPGRSALILSPLVWLPGKLNWVLGKVHGRVLSRYVATVADVRVAAA
eukprot:2550390-Prymnesium_polylepis.2